jgi:endonuclease-3
LSKDPRVAALLEFSTQIHPRELIPVLQEGAASVVEENPFAFALAAVLDRGTKSEIIWTIPYYLQKNIGNLNPRFFVDKSLKELEMIFRSLPFKPRYITDAPRTVKELSQIVIREYNGDVTKIWQDKTSTYVKSTFRRIFGVGPGIASMIVLLLEKCYRIHFSDLDHRTMDVKPDVHIVRVFQRLGFISVPNETEALEAARKLNPEYPGALDAPTWVVGKKWCTPFAPQCPACPLSRVCPKVT